MVLYEPRQLLWCSGVIIFLLMMGTAFTGYVLPWGQMSFLSNCNNQHGYRNSYCWAAYSAVVMGWLTVGNPTQTDFQFTFLLPFSDSWFNFNSLNFTS
jgi:ubiquinol-cytochrome c reductase cytochrome b subunit